MSSTDIPESKTKILAIAPFGIAVTDQHLLDDDQWYAGFLLRQDCEISYVAGDYSTKLLNAKYSKNKNIEIIKIPKNSNASSHVAFAIREFCKNEKSRRIILFGYSEKMIFRILPIIKLYKCDMYLVNTNNVTNKRFSRYYWFLFLMFKLLGGSLKKYIVHTEFEKEVALKYFPKLDGALYVKKHHMLLKDELEQKIGKSILKAKKKCTVISCFGPITSDKSVEVISDLLSFISERQEDFRDIEIRIFRIPPNLFRESLKKTKKLNVVFEDGFIESAVYREKIRESDLVVMNHNLNFEGKLSGIFADCISLAVPYLGLAIEPLVSFQMSHKIGFLLDSERRQCWQSVFGHSLTPEKRAEMCGRISDLNGQFSKEVLDEDYRKAFDLDASANK